VDDLLPERLAEARSKQPADEREEQTPSQRRAASLETQYRSACERQNESEHGAATEANAECEPIGGIDAGHEVIVAHQAVSQAMAETPAPTNRLVSGLEGRSRPFTVGLRPFARIAGNAVDLRAWLSDMQATMLPAPTAPTVTTPRAPWVLLTTVLLGVVTQALFFHAGLGLDWLLWDLLMIGVTIAVLGKAPLRAPAIGASVVAALLGMAFVFHRGDFTSWVALPANLAVLAALPVIVSSNLSFAELGSLPTRSLGALFRAPWAIFVTVLLPRDAVVVLDGGNRNVARRTVAGLLLGLPISALFTVLLCGDAGFAATIGRVEARADTAITFAVQALVTAVMFALGYGVFANETVHPYRTAPTAADAPYRQVDEAPAQARVSSLTWGIVLAQVAAVFLVYAFVHRDTEFGGHDVVRARGALTYASNLHAGFYQLLLATMLSVGLVVLGHKLLTADEGPVPGGAALIGLESALLLLTGVALYSCAHRLRLYEEAYGATLLRLGVAFVVLGAVVVLACTLVKSVFRGFRAFGALTLTALTACVVGAAWFDADAYVARKNLERTNFDVAYLASLTADACAVADHPALRDRPEAKRELIQAWRAHTSQGDWRSMRGFTRCPSVPGP